MESQETGARAYSMGGQGTGGGEMDSREVQVAEVDSREVEIDSREFEIDNREFEIESREVQVVEVGSREVQVVERHETLNMKIQARW